MEQEPFSQPSFAHQPVPRPKNWLVESILVTMFCCIVFGVIGIIFAANVNSKYDRGDYEGAIKASKQAGTWTKIGFGIGLVIIIACVIFVFTVGSSGLANYR